MTGRIRLLPLLVLLGLAGCGTAHLTQEQWVDAMQETYTPGMSMHVVETSVRNKAEVVAEDEREGGSRALLNYGHSFGHALETETTYSQFLHGEAVAIGMVIAARLSERRGFLGTGEAARLERLLRAMGLPTSLPAAIDPTDLIAHLALDKKKIDDPVGAISVHGTVGIWGILAVLITDADATLGGQLVGLLTIFVWVFVASLITWAILKAVMGLRVSEEEEYEGVDISECGMEAYPEFTASGSGSS